MEEEEVLPITREQILKYTNDLLSLLCIQAVHICGLSRGNWDWSQSSGPCADQTRSLCFSLSHFAVESESTSNSLFHSECCVVSTFYHM